MYISTERFRYCSECLRMNGYIRKVWDLYPYTTCHIHKQLLIDICPACNSKIILHNSKKFHCNKCSFYLIESSVTPRDNVNVSKLIYERLHNYIWGYINSDKQLKKLNLDGLVGVLIFIANSLTEYLDSHISVIKRLNISELEECLMRLEGKMALRWITKKIRRIMHKYGLIAK